ncbi:MAG: hypothetical protein DLM73_14930 [Chthoniobacterales bacterium]|nr:MAG: hypothetical protein DLM73_14930 [Chthoniobacterales bacterium]
MAARFAILSRVLVSLRGGFVCAGFLLALGPAVAGNAPERSVSASRQFIVYGTDLRVRGVICDLAEKAKSDLLRLLDQRDQWTTPIVINAQFPQANLPEAPSAALNFSQTGFGLKLQLDLTIASDVSGPEVRRELLRAIVLELMYRRHSDVRAGTAYSSPPDWFVDGISAQPSDFEQAPVTDLLVAPVAAGKIVPLEEFLHQRPGLLEASGRALYRAYAFALVDLLVHAPDGPHRLSKFISDFAAASTDPLADLRTHFPELFGVDGNAERSWTTQVARLSVPRPYQLLGAAETERMLEATLHFKITGSTSDKTYQLREFADFPRRPKAKIVFDALTYDLNALATRANPIYRPIIFEYAKITARLAADKRNGIAARLQRLAAMRQTVAKQMRGIDDYMNWFEATKSRGPSGAFTDYLKAAEAAARPEQSRRDAISVYLDVLESQFQD